MYAGRRSSSLFSLSTSGQNNGLVIGKKRGMCLTLPKQTLTTQFCSSQSTNKQKRTNEVICVICHSILSFAVDILTISAVLNYTYMNAIFSPWGPTRLLNFVALVSAKVNHASLCV